MPKKIPLTEIRKWLAEFEDGKSEATIASQAGHSVKTVKRGIEQARMDRDSASARGELIRVALQKHQDDLLAVVNNIVVALEVPPIDLALTRDGTGKLSPLRLPCGTITYDSQQGLLFLFDDETNPEWELLHEHLQRDRMWKLIDQWKGDLLAHIKARLAFQLEIEQRTREKTGYKFQEKAGAPPFLYSSSVTGILYQSALDKVLGAKFTDKPGDALVADTGRGVVRWGVGTLVAEAPSAEEKCKADILSAYEKVVNSDKAKSVKETYEQLEAMTLKARRAVQELSLLRLIPGQCRVCRRLGI